MKRCRGSRGEDVSSRQGGWGAGGRSEGESGDVAARGGRTSQTRQVHAGQKRKDYSCDPFLKFYIKLSGPFTPEKRLLHFSPAGRERERKITTSGVTRGAGGSAPTWYVKVFWRLDGGGCV